MADIKPPVLVEPISDITLNAGSELHLDLRDHIHTPNEDSGKIRFVVTLDDGEPLPEGLSCTPEGELTGTVGDEAVRPESYHLLFIAKNAADVPLITYSDLIIIEAVLADDAENIFDETLDVGELPGDDLEAAFDESLGEPAKAAMEELRNFKPDRIAQDEYQELYIEHMLRRYSSLQIYNAEFDGEMGVDAANVETAKSGWKIYHDGEFAMSTSNPDVYDTYLNRGTFIETVREMVEKAADKGWKTLGVAGFDKHVGLQLIHQHNRLEAQKPANEQRTFDSHEILGLESSSCIHGSLMPKMRMIVVHECWLDFWMNTCAHQ